jgi:hypothetical protein
MLENPSEVEESVTPPQVSRTELMVVSVNAVLGTRAPKSMKFSASIFSKRFIMLVDSGSSSSFISEQLVASNPLAVLLSQAMEVCVANGQTISCATQVPQCKVSLQGYCFKIDLKVLPLQCYDVILGNWLASNNPM